MFFKEKRKENKKNQSKENENKCSINMFYSILKHVCYSTEMCQDSGNRCNGCTLLLDMTTRAPNYVLRYVVLILLAYGN